MAELIDKSQIDSNKFSVIMTFCNNNITFFKQCSHCKRISHEELMCWNKYSHKKKKFERKKKNEKPKSDDNSEDNFSDNFMLNSNSTSNSTFKSFSNMKSSASTLSFMSITDQHFLSVWIINTETSDHLCSMWEFFSSYQSVVQSLKMFNESA